MGVASGITACDPLQQLSSQYMVSEREIGIEVFNYNLDAWTIKIDSNHHPEFWMFFERCCRMWDSSGFFNIVRHTEYVTVSKDPKNSDWTDRPNFGFRQTDTQTHRQTHRHTWHMAHDTWHMTHDTWHMTHDTWHMTHDTWHMTHNTPGTFEEPRRGTWNLSRTSLKTSEVFDSLPFLKCQRIKERKVPGSQRFFRGFWVRPFPYMTGIRPFLMALTDLDLKPGIVYYFFT